MVTHQAEATARADRVLRLQDGRLVDDRARRTGRGDDQVHATG
jgi:ABC-type transport system involved in cytochrome bd biosynthesis fused ATPase/permease subunit